MSLKQKINDDIKSAMKAKDMATLTILRGVSAGVKQFEVDKRQDADDKVYESVINKEIKKLKDALEFAEKAKREDLIEQNKSEMVILQKYLGEPLTEEELKATIQSQIDGGANSIGQIMGYLNANHKGCFDGRAASGIIKELLG